MFSKKSIRPNLNLSFGSEREKFQNQTLRPILKLQHSIIILLFKNWVKKYKIELGNLSKDHFNQILENSFSKNNAVKNKLLGIVIGQFTDEEFENYDLNSSEYNKRVFSMIKKRLFDSFEELKKN